MSGATAYQKFTAIRLHFTSDEYDYFKYCGKTRARFNAARNDSHVYARLERRYGTDEELIDYIVANFATLQQPGWVGAMHERHYVAWRGRIESMKYVLNKELGAIASKYTDDRVAVSEIWSHTSSDTHPEFLQMILRKQVSLETAAIVNDVADYARSWDSTITEDVVWPTVRRLLKKYSPFLARRVGRRDVWEPIVLHSLGLRRTS